MLNYSAFPFCISRLLLELGLRVPREVRNDKYTCRARTEQLPECVGREKEGEEKGNRKESQEDGENSVQQSGRRPHYLTASSQLYDLGSLPSPLCR